MNISQKRYIEEICLNSWPSLKIFHVDGWDLRYSFGLTRRANCVVPMQEGARDLLKKIQYCNDIYQSQNLLCYFRISPVGQPFDLDHILADQGFVVEAPTFIMEARIPSPQYQAKFIDLNTKQNLWVRFLCEMKGWDSRQEVVLSNLLNKIFGQKLLISYQKDNEVVGVALGVLQEDYLSILHLIVSPSNRKEGIATKLINSMFVWAKNVGCNKAMVSVEKNNTNAISMYKKNGFESKSMYHFRRK